MSKSHVVGVVGIVIVLLLGGMAYSQVLVVKGQKVNVRAGAGTTYAILGTVLEGEQYPIIEHSSGWYKVRLEDGQEGWISGKVAEVTGTGTQKGAMERQQREDPRTMTQSEWQAIAQKVTMNLHWIGIQMGVPPQVRAVYVPALTQDYLQAFQLSLQQGATKQPADILASQYIFARIQQLSAQSGGSSGGDDGCVYSRGGSFCRGSDGFMSFSFR